MSVVDHAAPAHRWRGFAFALPIALLTIVPLLTVVGMALTPQPEIWQHLWNYVLPRVLGNTVLLKPAPSCPRSARLFAEVLQQAFGAAVMNGQSDAARLARRLPEDQLANLLLAGADAQAGRWDRAEQRLRALPRRGSAQLLQPLLVAWAQAGRGDTAQALALLRPFIEDGRLRGVIALHAAMIADLGGQSQDAARYLRLAIADTREPNLRLAQIGAGILARAGQEAQGARLFDVMARGNDDIAMVVTPGATAYLLTDRFPRLIVLSVAIGAGTSFLGAYLSYFLNGATGGIIVCLQTTVFLLAFFLAPKHGRLAARRRTREAA